MVKKLIELTEKNEDENYETYMINTFTEEKHENNLIYNDNTNINNNNKHSPTNSSTFGDNLPLKLSEYLVDDANWLINQNTSILNMNEKISETLIALWEDRSIKKVFDMRHEFGGEFCLTDSSKYFLDDLERITDPYYIPSEYDIIKCYYRTTGVAKESIKIKQLDMSIWDTGTYIYLSAI